MFAPIFLLAEFDAPVMDSVREHSDVVVYL